MAPIKATIEGAGEPEAALGKSLKAYALAQLAKRECSRTELRRKLLVRARTGEAATQQHDARADPLAIDAAPEARDETVTARCADAVLDWLEAHRYLSEQRFIESRIRVRSARFGTLRIRHELAQHGLQLPTQAEAALRDSEFERAFAICARKFAALPLSPTADARRARFLAGRGFSGEVIRQVLRKLRPGDPIHVATQAPVTP